jgi:hypothetical protein
MRLLERKTEGELILTQFTDKDIPAYAILPLWTASVAKTLTSDHNLESVATRCCVFRVIDPDLYSPSVHMTLPKIKQYEQCE